MADTDKPASFVNRAMVPGGSVNTGNINIVVDDVDKRPKAVDDEAARAYRKQTRQLRKFLKMFFYGAIKWKEGICSIHLIYCLVLLIQTVKVILITTQMLSFGYDRANFSSVVNRGHLALRHLLLKDWDAGWETLPYPPAHGDFAVYTIDDLVGGVNFAVERYLNSQNEAIGYYVQRPDDKMKIKLTHFDFPGFDDSDLNTGVEVHEDSFAIKYGLHSQPNGTDSITNETIYTYNYSILEELEHANLTHPIKRLLEIVLDFDLHSVRVYAKSKQVRCLRIKGEVTFRDLDNNGQVNVDLNTLTTKIRCASMDITAPDWVLADTSRSVGGAVIAFCVLSLLITLLTVVFSVFCFLKTKQYMKLYFKKFFKPLDESETDLPGSEYFRFVKIWDAVVVIGDVCTMHGTIFVVFNIEDSEWVLEILDSYTVVLGVGCILAWFNLLRFFKFHEKFHLLFSTLYGAFWDVMAYLVCVIIMFLGFWVCGYVVMGPYHVKFRTPQASMETLFGIVNGDEIFVTMATLEEDKSGGDWVYYFSRVYVVVYVSIFTIVVINLLIAIFMSSYESIKTYYSDKPAERDLGEMERALQRFLTSKDGVNNTVRNSMYEMMSSGNQGRSNEETSLWKQMNKVVRLSDKQQRFVPMKPRTLKALMEDEGEERRLFDCKLFKVSFAMFYDRHRD